MKSRDQVSGFREIRLPRSRHERHDFAMIAPQHTNSQLA
jgi:hypothetical protein